MAGPGRPGGAFTVGLVLAARMLPNLLFGLAAGTLADRGNRTRLLAGVRLLALPPALGLAWLSAAQSESVSVWALVVLSFATGCATVFDVPTRQALVLDTVPREAAPNAMALNATASRLSIALGALVAGALIPMAGVAAAFVVSALTFALAAGIGLFIRPTAAIATTAHGPQPTFAQALRDALRLIGDIAEVRILVAAAIACEIFGFSYQTAVPTFSRDVLGAGAEGLGTLNAATSLGGALGLVLLALVPGRVPRATDHRTGVFSPTAFRSWSWRPPAASRSRRRHCWSPARARVPSTSCSRRSCNSPSRRLTAVARWALWVLSIGSAPIGNLEMGAAVAAFGAPAALAINGGLVLLAADHACHSRTRLSRELRILYDRSTSRRESES